MGRIWVVATREFVETVKTRAFLFGAVLMPLIISGLMFGMRTFNSLMDDERLPMRTVAVVDHTGGVLKYIEASIAKHNKARPEQPIAIESVPADADDVDALRQRVRDGSLYAYLLVPAGAVQAGETCRFGRKDNRLEVVKFFETIVNEAIVSLRFESADPPLDLARIRALQERVALRSVDVESGRESSSSDFASILTPFIFLFVLFSGTLGISQGLLTSLIEEKNSRVIEVLLSAISPLELMAGKILGTVAVGGMLLTIWGTLGYVAARVQGYDDLVTGVRLFYAVLYFVPSFLLFSSMLGAVGSACNTLKEAQSMSFPLTIITIIPMLLWLSISQNPGSVLAVTLSYIPPLTPFVMILRVCADPNIPIWQVVTTLMVLWSSVGFTIWCAAKVFRVGVLMYGKPPTLRELIRWIRLA